MTVRPQDKTARTIGDTWGKYLTQALAAPYLMMLFLGSILLSVASFYTTFDGMLDFMPIWVFSAFITFAIQALLFVTSWRLGFMFAEKERTAWLDVVVFVVCFVTSVFFSFSSLFNFIFDQGLQERTRMTRMHNAVEETIADLEFRAKEQRKELVEELIETSAYKVWRGNVLRVAEAAVGAEERLSTIFSERFRERRKRVAEAEQVARETASKKDTLDRNIAEAKRELERLEQERSPLQGEVARLRQLLSEANDKVIAKKAEMDAESGGGDPASGRPRGRGPVWGKLRNEHHILIAKRDGIGHQLQLKQRELESLDTQHRTLQDRIDADTVLQASIDTRVTATAEEARLAREELEHSGQQETFNPAESVETLRNYLNEFSKEFDPQPFNKVANLCTELLEEMRKISALGPIVDGLSCDRGAMSALINPISDAADALAAFQRECVVGGENARTVTGLSFDDSLVYARNCMSLSGLQSSRIRDLRREIDRLEREENEKASPFTKTSNALVSGEKLALFSLAIAMTIDLLVLFSGLIGAKSVRPKVLGFIEGSGRDNVDELFTQALDTDLTPYPTDKPAIRRIKSILRHANAESVEAGGIQYGAKIDLAEIPDPETQLDVKQAMVAFSGKGYAAPDKTAPGIFHVRQGFLDYLRHELADYRKQRPFPGEAPEVPGQIEIPAPSPVVTTHPRTGIRFEVLSPHLEMQRQRQADRYADTYHFEGQSVDGRSEGHRSSRQRASGEPEIPVSTSSEKSSEHQGRRVATDPVAPETKETSDQYKHIDEFIDAMRGGASASSRKS